ncbi:hypothetical protein AB0C27_31010 [Nonomuraea sp. NPDC048882]|uniref:hypothetical protein n=1 Tax=Nonomuraea sp. NPDC048882 TaxID=3154347 RepID=UPI0033C8DE73
MDWAALVGTVVGGAIVLAGQAVESMRRRRDQVGERSHAAALAAKDLFLEMASTFERRMMSMDRSYVAQNDPDYHRDLRSIAGHIYSIKDAPTRKRLLRAVEILGDIAGLAPVNRQSPDGVGLSICTVALNTLGANLRSEKIPASPLFQEYDEAYSALQEMYAEEYEEYRKGISSGTSDNTALTEQPPF